MQQALEMQMSIMCMYNVRRGFASKDSNLFAFKTIPTLNSGASVNVENECVIWR